MPQSVKRRYHSRVRSEQATATRQAVLRSAREHFTTRGYAATGVADIAAAAGVNVDTVYASVGRKPQLMLAVIDMALGSSDEPVGADERDYVRPIRAAGSARSKLVVYAQALGRIMPRVAPLLDALGQAALADPECAQLHDHLAQRRRANMTLFAADLRSTGQLRDELSDEDVADLVWATNAPEFFSRITAQGWTPGRYVALLTDLWIRTLLRTPER